MKIEVSGSIRKNSTFRMNISWMDAQQRPKITQIITQRVNRLSAKYDSEKMKQNNSWRVFSKENLGKVSKMHLGTLEHYLCHLTFLMYQTIYFSFTFGVQYIQIHQSVALKQ